MGSSGPTRGASRTAREIGIHGGYELDGLAIRKTHLNVYVQDIQRNSHRADSGENCGGIFRSGGPSLGREDSEYVGSLWPES